MNDIRDLYERQGELSGINLEAGLRVYTLDRPVINLNTCLVITDPANLVNGGKYRLSKLVETDELIDYRHVQSEEFLPIGARVDAEGIETMAGEHIGSYADAPSIIARGELTYIEIQALQLTVRGHQRDHSTARAEIERGYHTQIEDLLRKRDREIDELPRRTFEDLVRAYFKKR